MFQFLYCCIVYNLIIWKPCASQYIGNTAGRMIEKIILMTKELVMDVINKVQSVQQFRATLYKDSSFQMGGIMSSILNKYYRMVESYKLVLYAVRNKTFESYMDKVVESDSLRHGIGNLIQMMEVVEEKKVKDTNLRMRSLRTNEEVETWLHLVESKNNEPRPEVEKNKTHRKNSKWHYTGLDDFAKK